MADALSLSEGRSIGLRLIPTAHDLRFAWAALREQKLEERIVESRVPGISQTLRTQIVGFINQVRTLDLKKLPSVSETIDWARVLVLLHSTELDHETVKETLNVLLKYEADIETTMPQVTTFVARAGRQGVFG